MVARQESRIRRRPGWLLRPGPGFLIGPPPAGYNIYSNAGSGPINYNTPIATVYSFSWTSPPLAHPDTWRFGVRAFNNYGEEKNLDAAVTIILDACGNDITLAALPTRRAAGLRPGRRCRCGLSGVIRS